MKATKIKNNMALITKKQIKLSQRKTQSQKGDNGLVLAVGGSVDYPGAIALAGLAALRSGCDLVKIIAPQKVAWAINAYSQDLVTKKIPSKFFLPKHLSIIKHEMERFDVLLIGNGIGQSIETKKFCVSAVRSIEKHKVIDADAIKAISIHDAKNSIITPHSRELNLFLSNSKVRKSLIEKISAEENIAKKSELIKNTAQEFLDKKNIILLKGKIDSIISKDKILLVKGGNSGMTKGGTGDVLAGLCAGFLAQSKDLLQSAINASYFNKKIGDILLKKKRGFTYLASDMAMEIKRIVGSNS